jgi:hypothetical protein
MKKDFEYWLYEIFLIPLGIVGLVMVAVITGVFHAVFLVIAWLGHLLSKVVMHNEFKNGR